MSTRNSIHSVQTKHGEYECDLIHRVAFIIAFGKNGVFNVQKLEIILMNLGVWATLLRTTGECLVNV